MVNILLETYTIDAPWLYPHLKPYLRPKSKVAVVAFSFRDNCVRGLEDWNMLYGRENGRIYHGIVKAFASYGILENDISFLNYFSDDKTSAANKIKQADIIYFLGGLPDRMMDRIREFDLFDLLMSHQETVMGYSAGAVIQFAEYYLSPDGDYPEFGYYNGLPYLDRFYLEVHYQNTAIQNCAIDRVLHERSKTVYATHFAKGAIVVDNGVIELIGDVETFIK